MVVRQGDRRGVRGYRNPIAKFKTSGHHADYEMKVESDKITKGQKVYAVVLTDTDGNTYGLHHVT